MGAPVVSMRITRVPGSTSVVVRVGAAGLHVEGDGVGLLLEAAIGLVVDEAGGDDGERQAEGEDDDEDGAEDRDQQPRGRRSAARRSKR